MREQVHYQSFADAMEARAGIEPAIELLQSPALPLGYLAIA
jgi:hypothetical protein